METEDFSQDMVFMERMKPYLNIAYLLIENGCDINLKNSKNQYPFDLCLDIDFIRRLNNYHKIYT